MLDYVLRAQGLIKKMSPYLKYCNSSPMSYVRAVERFNKERHRNVRVQHGSTRMVLLCSDFVIKIDYCHDDMWGDSRTEYNFFQYVKHTPFNYLFAPIYCFNYKNRNYYIMPYIPDVGRGEDDIGAYLSEEEVDWLNNNVRDLHYENYGFDYDYNPIIIDYASNYLTPN